MPWTADTILNLWQTRSDILEPQSKHLRAYAAGFAQIANMADASDPLTVAKAICACEACHTPNAIRDAFVDWLERTEDVPVAASLVRFVAQEVATLVPDDMQRALDKIRDMRTPDRTVRGKALAKAAKQLLGQWQWAQRGPDSLLPYREEREKSKDINAFSRWVRVGARAPAPRGTTHLNCVEAVLVTAHAANLLTSGQLRAAFGEAEQRARRGMGEDVALGLVFDEPEQRAQRGLAEDAALRFQRTPAKQWSEDLVALGNRAYRKWVRTIERRLLKYQDAQPVRAQFGLIPQAGDLVFVRGSPLIAHVCISLGKDQVASLWEHDGGRFSRQDLYSMGNVLNLAFVPCPF